MDLRWRYGIFLGHLIGSDQNIIGLHDGTITYAKAMARVVEGVRWSTEWVMGIHVTPLHANPIDLDLVETDERPHAPPADAHATHDATTATSTSRIQHVPFT